MQRFKFLQDVESDFRLFHVTLSHRYVFRKFRNLSELIKMFSWKFITKKPIPNFSLDFSKVGFRFSRKRFYEVGQVSKSSKQISLQFKTSLNSLWPSISQLWSKQNEKKRNGVTFWSYRYVDKPLCYFLMKGKYHLTLLFDKIQSFSLILVINTDLDINLANITAD
jgi:hypothetical protein